MGAIVNVVPKDIFKDVVESMKTIVPVTNVTQSGSETTLYFDTTTTFSKNYILCNCGDLQGYYRVNKYYDNKVIIDYSGSFETTGTVKTKPYYDWGSIKEGHISINNNAEFPLIFFILPTPYSVNLNKNELEFISSDFKFLIIDVYKAPKGEEKNTTDYLFGEVVSEMSDLALSFQQNIKKHKLIMKDSTFRRSEEIPFGVTFSGDNGSDESLVQMSAGCYVEASVQIQKNYNC